MKTYTERFPPGVIFVLKNVNSEINIDKQNRLHPYYLVYIDKEHKVLVNHVDSKRSLDYFRSLCLNKVDPENKVCDAIEQETDGYHHMEEYSELLRESIGSIINVEQERDINSLFKPGGTTTLTGSIKGIEDFKLISFLIIK